MPPVSFRNWAASRLHTCCWGGKLGDYYRELAEARGITLYKVEVACDTRINVTLLQDGSCGEEHYLSPGPRVEAREVADLERMVFKHAESYSACLFAGSLPQGLPATFYRDLILRFERRGLRCALDADGEALIQGVKATPFLIKPNEEEIEVLAGRKLRNTRVRVAFARRLVQSGIRHVLVSLGAEGALIVTDQCEPFFVRPPRVRVQRTVGAGDSFVASYLFGLEKKWSIERSAAFAAATGTAAVANRVWRGRIKKDTLRFLKQVKIEAIQ